MPSMQELQQGLHGAGHDYAIGSPHLRHFAVRSMIVDQLQDIVREILDKNGRCRVLELGAGHGTFTDSLIAAGATVEVTEMSKPSAAVLRDRFRHVPAVTIIDDPTGVQAVDGGEVDLVVCLSVLHHIPDYLRSVSGMVGRVAPGGAFVSFQDPLWYPRREWWDRKIERAFYLAWRIPKGDLARGFSTLSRRARGVWDEENPSDMVEYHVMRDGLDEVALERLLRRYFEDTRLVKYWSTQGDWAQSFGARVCRPNTFGFVAKIRYSG